MPPFLPTPDLTSEILKDLTSAAISLIAIAEVHHTTLDALTLWMREPEIAQKLADIDSAAAMHARLAASNHLPLAVAALADTLAAYRREESEFQSNSRADANHRDHHRATARRAATLLLRIARHTTIVNHPAAPPHPPQGGSASSRGRASSPTSSSDAHPSLALAVTARTDESAAAHPATLNGSSIENRADHSGTLAIHRAPSDHTSTTRSHEPGPPPARGIASAHPTLTSTPLTDDHRSSQILNPSPSPPPPSSRPSSPTPHHPDSSPLHKPPDSPSSA